MANSRKAAPSGSRRYRLSATRAKSIEGAVPVRSSTAAVSRVASGKSAPIAESSSLGADVALRIERMAEAWQLVSPAPAAGRSAPGRDPADRGWSHSDARPACGHGAVPDAAQRRQRAATTDGLQRCAGRSDAARGEARGVELVIGAQHQGLADQAGALALPTPQASMPVAREPGGRLRRLPERGRPPACAPGRPLPRASEARRRSARPRSRSSRAATANSGSKRFGLPVALRRPERSQFWHRP
jgi:hypothetical protein